MGAQNEGMMLAMFVATAILGVLNILMAFILNSIRSTMSGLAESLQQLNNLVRSDYIKRDAVEKIERDLYRVIHDRCASPLQSVRSDVDRLLARQNMMPTPRTSDGGAGKGRTDEDF